MVEIAEDGTVRPLGETAMLRLQGRGGRFKVAPSPPNMVVLKRAEADAGDRPCTLSGELQSAGTLCDVLSFIGGIGWRGELVVEAHDAARSIFLDQGDVVGAQSTVTDERLGEVLYRQGVLTREQVDVCARASASGELRFGEVAVKN